MIGSVSKGNVKEEEETRNIQGRKKDIIFISSLLGHALSVIIL